MLVCSLLMRSNKRLVHDVYLTDMLDCSLLMRSRKRLAHDVYLTDMQALFLMSKIQTVRHKMAALRATSSQLSSTGIGCFFFVF